LADTQQQVRLVVFILFVCEKHLS